MNRIYHPYHHWEDWKAGMWRKVNTDEYLHKAIEFTGNHELYGHWMMQVVHTWPIACEHNLTDLTQNRRAWIGHAACQLAINCPEHVTRSAWGYLTKEQQDLANGVADRAIKAWERIDNRGNREKGLFD